MHREATRLILFIRYEAVTKQCPMYNENTITCYVLNASANSLTFQI